MLKSLFATGALLAAAASVSGVDFSSAGVSVAGEPVTEATLQLHEANGGTILASRERIESLTGVVEVTVGGGRAVRLEPGVRLGRSGDAWEVSSHGRRPVELTSEGGSVIVSSPVRVTPADGGWTLGDGSRLEGRSLQAGLAADLGVRRVAEGFDVPPDGDHDDMLLTPRQRVQKRKAAAAEKLDTRRLVANDPMPGAEAADEVALKRIGDVSPAGF